MARKLTPAQRGRNELRPELASRGFGSDDKENQERRKAPPLDRTTGIGSRTDLPDDWVDIVGEVCSRPYRNVDLAARFGVSVRTLQHWRQPPHQHAEGLNHAILAAEAAMIGMLSKIVYDSAVGKPTKGNVQDARWLLAKFAKDQYGDNQGKQDAAPVIIQLSAPAPPLQDVTPPLEHALLPPPGEPSTDGG